MNAACPRGGWPVGGLLATVALALAACSTGSGGTSDDGRPRVVATTTILGDVVGRIAGDGAVVQTLMPRGVDPHGFEPSARQAARLRAADLVVANGLGLEAALQDTLAAAAADGARVLALGEHLDPRPSAIPDAHADDDPHEDDDNGSVDPHVWMDPLRMADGIDVLADELAAIGVDGVGERAAAYRAEVEALSADIAERIASIPQERRTLVTNHVAYGYYADRYGLRLLGTVIPSASTGSETSAARFAALVELIEREGVRAVFASTTESTDLAATLTDEVGREVAVVELYTGSLGDDGSGAATYLGMMDVTTDRIVEALR